MVIIAPNYHPILVTSSHASMTDLHVYIHNECGPYTPIKSSEGVSFGGELGTEALPIDYQNK